MNKLRQVDLIRHAESENNHARLYIGGKALDAVLSQRGVYQAISFGSQYRPLRDGTILASSPAERALSTAQLAFPNHIVTLDDRLLEIDRGEHEDKLVSEVYTDEFLMSQLRDGFDHRSPGGESLNEGADRLFDFLDDVEPGSRVVAITHSRITKAAVARILGYSFADTRDRDIIDIGNVEVTRFEKTNKDWRVAFVGKSALEVAIEDRKYRRNSA